MKKCFLSLVVLQMLLIISCRNKVSVHDKDILINKLSKWEANSELEYTSLKILSSFPAINKCTSDKYYSDLYVCETRLRPKIDTIYIFNECSASTNNVINKKTNQEVGFFASDTLKIQRQSTTISVPDSFQIPQNAKYLFAKLNITEEM